MIRKKDNTSLLLICFVVCLNNSIHNLKHYISCLNVFKLFLFKRIVPPKKNEHCHLHKPVVSLRLSFVFNAQLVFYEALEISVPPLKCYFIKMFKLQKVHENFVTGWHF